jgi:proteasome lid subunit RPN8/RPN11
MQDVKSTLLKLFDPEDLSEKCGLILTDKSIIPSSNLHDSPQDGFVVDPQDLIRYEDQLWGTWHTHPNGSSNLSREDYAGFLQWPELHHFIIGVDGVRCFVVEDGFVLERNIG